MPDKEFLRAKKILRTLKVHFSIPDISSIIVDPFKVLIRTIISQSTAEINTVRAYNNLIRRLPVTPKALAESDVRVLEDVLRVAGLFRNKAKIIKKVSEVVLEKYENSLEFVYSSSLNEARENLMSLPGVGPKTADIVLLFCAKKPTLPVDTHVNRVSKRLGLALKNGNYENVRGSLQALYPPEDYFSVHMLFISLGRNYCKALRPLHERCPVFHLCPLMGT